MVLVLLYPRQSWLSLLESLVTPHSLAQVLYVQHSIPELLEPILQYSSMTLPKTCELDVFGVSNLAMRASNYQKLQHFT